MNYFNLASRSLRPWIASGIRLGFAAIAALSLNAQASAQTPENLPTDGLLAYYAFDGGTAENLAADNLHGTLFGAPTVVADRHGNPEGALHFAAATDFVRVLDSQSAHPLPFSISLWFSSDVDFPSTVNTPLFRKYIPAAWNGIQVGYRRTTDEQHQVTPWYLRNYTQRVIGDYGLPPFDWITEDVVAEELAEWHHAVFTVDSVGGKLYIDGSMVAETPWDGAPAQPTSSYRWQFAGGYEWADTLGYHGAIDDVGVWDLALTADQVNQIYSPPLPISSGCGNQSSLTYQGTEYALVDIAGTCWFQQNLATPVFANGDTIPYVTEGPGWPSYSQPRRCLYQDSLALLEETGYMYNFVSVLDERGLCPTGWSVASPEQFTAAVDSFGSNNIHHRVAETWDPQIYPEGLNTSGFSGKGFGERSHQGFDENWGVVSTFWSDEEPLPQSGERWILGHGSGYPFQSFAHLKARGAYIRCTADAGTIAEDGGEEEEEWDCSDLVLSASLDTSEACAGDTIFLSVSTPTLSVPALNIGDTLPAGGIIFYDKGYESDGWRYLAADTADAFGTSTGMGCYCVGIDYTTGIGSGYENTAVWADAGCSGAATTVVELPQTAPSPWYIPSIEELELLYTELVPTGLVEFPYDRYVSSTPGPYGSCGIDGGHYQVNFTTGNTYAEYRAAYGGSGTIRLIRTVSAMEAATGSVVWSNGATDDETMVIMNDEPMTVSVEVMSPSGEICSASMTFPGCPAPGPEIYCGEGTWWNAVTSTCEPIECGACPGDLNGDGEINLEDILDILNLYETLCPIGGCTVPEATNYSPTAEWNDGSCTFE